MRASHSHSSRAAGKSTQKQQGQDEERSEPCRRAFKHLPPSALRWAIWTPNLIDSYALGDPAQAGRAYAVNVFGCILGPLVSSYALLPWLGEAHRPGRSRRAVSFVVYLRHEVPPAVVSMGKRSDLDCTDCLVAGLFRGFRPFRFQELRQHRDSSRLRGVSGFERRRSGKEIVC